MRGGVGLAVLLAAGVASATAHASIGPGVLMTSEKGECTAGFAFTDGADLYLSFDAHCAEAPDSSGEYCRKKSLPLGAPVTIEGATKPGRLAYSSFAVMLAVQEDAIAICNNNDFGLVRIDPADRALVDPTVPVFGGPTGLRRAPVASGEKLLNYGSSSLRQGIEELKPHEGLLATDFDESWAHWVYFVPAGIPGDSGSAVMDASGSAVGSLVSLNSVPPGANNVGDLARALDYAKAHGGPDVRVLLGASFTGPRLGPGAVPSPPPEQQPPLPAPPPPAQPAPPPAASAAPAPAAAPAAAPKAKPKKAKAKPKCKKRKRGKKRRCPKPRRRSRRH